MPEITIRNFIRDYGNALDDRDDLQSKWIFKNPYDTLAVEYLEQALNLINNNPSRAERINALSNVKLAVHRRTDTLLYLYWLRDRSNHHTWDFPNKCNALRRLKIIYPDSTSHIRMINRLRNPVEHQYRNPPDNQKLETLAIITGYYLRETALFLSTPELLVYPQDNLKFLFDLDNNRITIQENNTNIEFVRSGHSIEWETLAQKLFSEEIKNYLNILDRLCSCGYDPFLRSA